MPNQTPEVDAFLRELSHPMKDEIVEVRAAILASDEQITEHIKWKAPSFCYHGDDRVTFRLLPEGLQLVFHRGAKVRDDSTDQAAPPSVAAVGVEVLAAAAVGAAGARAASRSGSMASAITPPPSESTA
jgi:hypothetical protein